MGRKADSVGHTIERRRDRSELASVWWREWVDGWVGLGDWEHGRRMVRLEDR